MSNNRAERSLRSFCIGRRNFLFSDTPKGAEASAVLFSVMQTALDNRLKPYEYFEWVLTELPNVDFAADPDAFTRFLPYSTSVPAKCRLKPDEASLEVDEDAIVLMPEGMDIEEFDYLTRKMEEFSESSQQ